MIPPQNKNNLSFRKVENFIIYHPWAKPKLKYMINHTFIRLNTKYPVNLFYFKESCLGKSPTMSITIGPAIVSRYESAWQSQQYIFV